MKNKVRHSSELGGLRSPLPLRAFTSVGYYIGDDFIQTDSEPIKEIKENEWRVPVKFFNQVCRSLGYKTLKEQLENKKKKTISFAANETKEIVFTHKTIKVTNTADSIQIIEQYKFRFCPDGIEGFLIEEINAVG